MKLIDALRIAGEKQDQNLPTVRLALVCGFTPLHFQTFLAAHFRQASSNQQTNIKSGVYGDFWGNLEKATKDDAAIVLVILEWADLDARLGLRGLGSWSPTLLPDIVRNAKSRMDQFDGIVHKLSAEKPVFICLPTLPLPPISYTPGWQESAFALELKAVLADAALRAARTKSVKVLNQQTLDSLSPIVDRFDPKSELASGFPYKLSHASIMAELAAKLVYPPSPKKGLITDLDDTLWNGILGEVGVQNLSWDLERGGHMHGAYQRLLHALAESGILIGVASKNDPRLVTEALNREDLLLPKASIFPVEASWGQKSEAVGRILRAWNIAADSVVFIDDSPMELAEVKAGHPGIEAILFPKENHQDLNQLCQRLRDLFGKSYVSAEDSLRSQSIRQASVRAVENHASSQSLDKFLEQAEARFTFDFEKIQGDDRALELINKTNQFNLNGKRITEPLWRQFLKEEASFVATVSYQDKYGPLGKIAVLAGTVNAHTVRIESWVMSCRAFSRRIEHRSLEEVIDHFGAKELIFEFESTPRNGPLQDFFLELTGVRPTGKICLTANQIRNAVAHREAAGVANE